MPDAKQEVVKDGYLRVQVSEAIRLRMADTETSRAELARRMNTSRAAVTQMLAGTPNFETATLEKISAALGVQWLFIPTTTDYRKLRWEIGQLVGHTEDGGETCAPTCLGCNDPIAALIRDLREARSHD